MPLEEISPIEDQSTITIKTQTPKSEQSDTAKFSEDDKYKVDLGDKKWIISGTVIVGILTSVGGTISLLHKNEKKLKGDSGKSHSIDIRMEMVITLSHMIQIITMIHSIIHQAQLENLEGGMTKILSCKI